jgi:hypothetical protein
VDHKGTYCLKGFKLIVKKIARIRNSCLKDSFQGKQAGESFKLTKMA